MKENEEEKRKVDEEKRRNNYFEGDEHREIEQKTSERRDRSNQGSVTDDKEKAGKSNEIKFWGTRIENNEGELEGG